MLPHSFLPVFTDLLIPLLLAVNGDTTPSAPKLVRRVDLIELNHFHDEYQRHAYDQVIFYEWSPDYKRYHVIAWVLVENDRRRMPKHDRDRDMTVVRWTDRETQMHCEVWSKLYRETWSQDDPERANKKLLDEKYRMSLLQLPQRQSVAAR